MKFGETPKKPQVKTSLRDAASKNFHSIQPISVLIKTLDFKSLIYFWYGQNSVQPSEQTKVKVKLCFSAPSDGITDIEQT